MKEILLAIAAIVFFFVAPIVGIATIVAEIVRSRRSRQAQMERGKGKE